MPSYLYEVKDNQCHQIDTIKLSGWEGIIYQLYSSKKIDSKLSAEDDGIGWEITKADIKMQISANGFQGDHEIVFDIEPRKIRTNLK